MLEHNQITLNELEKYISAGQDCCVVNPCGSGKTSVMSEFVKHHKDNTFVILTKQVNAGDYYERMDPVFKGIPVYTYNKMLNDYKRQKTDMYAADFYLVDEAHYIGAAKWGKAFTYLRDRYNPIVVGFTATPQRFEDQGTDETIVTSFFYGHSAGNFTSKQLQDKGVFIEPEYILSLYDLSSEIEDKMDKIEAADLSDEQKGKYRAMLERVAREWEVNSSPEVVIRDTLPKYMYYEQDNKILVYCSRIADIELKAKEINKYIYKATGHNPKSYRYTSIDGEDELNAFMSDTGHYVKVLYSIDKIMETIHIDDLSVVLMLRPSVSNRIITQQFGRVNSIGNKNRTLIIDMVDNLSNIGAYNFLGGTYGYHGEKTDTNAPKIDISYVSLYRTVFDSIDRAFVKSTMITYNGYTGSLSQICDIFNKPYADVKMLISQGLSVEDAIDKTHGKKCAVSDEIFAGYVGRKDFLLSEKQKKDCTRYLPIVERFVKNREITDEDVIQELYMELLYRVSAMNEGQKTGARAYLINSVNSRYMRLMRHKHIRDGIFESFEHSGLCYDVDLCNHYIRKDTKEKVIPKMLKTLTPREQKVLTMRFGLDGGEPMTFDEIAKVSSVTRERIRQIEVKALRKLRHPARCRMYLGKLRYSQRDILFEYDE